MQIQLTKEQAKEIALQWIKDQQKVHDGYKPIIDILFTGGHFSPWSWFDEIMG